MSNNIKRFGYIRYFWDCLHLCLNGTKSVRGYIEGGIKVFKGVKDIKADGISGKRYISETYWYLRLSLISNKVSFISLSRFLCVSIIRL